MTPLHDAQSPAAAAYQRTALRLPPQIYLLSLAEVGGSSSSSFYDPAPPAAAGGAPPAKFGFAYLEAAAGRVFVGTAAEGELATLMVQVAPKEVLFCRGALSADARAAVLSAPARPKMVGLTPGDEFPLPGRAAHHLVGSFGAQSPAIGAAHAFFVLPPSRQVWFLVSCSRMSVGPSARLSAGIESEEDTSGWPAPLRGVPEPALAALAALRSHLRRFKQDGELAACPQVLPHAVFDERHLRLDGPTMVNLDILQCEASGGVRGSLLGVVGRCVSGPGARLMRRWLAAPLRNAAEIVGRQDAVEELAARDFLVQKFVEGAKCAVAVSSAVPFTPPLPLPHKYFQPKQACLRQSSH